MLGVHTRVLFDKTESREFKHVSQTVATYRYTVPETLATGEVRFAQAENVLRKPPNGDLRQTDGSPLIRGFDLRRLAFDVLFGSSSPAAMSPRCALPSHFRRLLHRPDAH